jgi:hypothetical protein
MEMIFCFHSTQAWPRGKSQRCLTCGAVREYEIGKRPGGWRYERREDGGKGQKDKRVLLKTPLYQYLVSKGESGRDEQEIFGEG